MDPQTLVAFALLAAAVVALVRRLRHTLREVEQGNACAICSACRESHGGGAKLVDLSPDPPPKS